ncbi:hypothetical protein FQK07_07045 [Synechococcus sp. BSF8S]|uniref:hypothetical protein n=1 Tax=Synechococcales TaxID=1890424 RepID=UPI001629AE96|nr:MULTISPECIES: hypothetical protein [unclassified Synechococcus]MBC1261033.1 hypothetical protein [Synechococcus sp. BSF8S]MBC1263936.1 hypothetical protein [Synechococcus sp. BSA11S]
MLRLCQKVEILDAQEDRPYSKGNRGSDLPDELRRRQEEAEEAKAARKEAIEAAENAGIELPDLERLVSAAGGFHAAVAMPWRGLERSADGTPTKKNQRNFTDPDGHLMKSDGHFIQGEMMRMVVA